MNNATDLRHNATAANANERVLRLFAAQQAAFMADPCPDVDTRRGRLKLLISTQI